MQLESDDEENSSDEASAPKIGVTWYRWVILLIFSLQNFVNSVLWICFVPIQSTIMAYYRVSNMYANLLTLLFLLCSLPTTFAAMMVQDRLGLHFVVYFGVMCQTVGAWLRYAGQGSEQFWLLILGSLVAGPAMACFMSTPSVVAALWFAEDQRAVAVAIASLSGVLGMLVGFILGPAIISTQNDIPTFLLVQALLPTGAGLLVLLFKRGPPFPSSLSTTAQKVPLLQSFKTVFKNQAFVVLLCGFALGVGAFNAVTTLVDQIVNPLGYNTDDSGLFGALLIVLGIVGAAIWSIAVEKTRTYKLYLLISVWGCVFVFLWMILALSPNNFGSLAASWSFLGFFALPILPLALECGVELTFPVPEVVTNGLLMSFGQGFGVVFTFIADAIADPVTQNMENSCWFLFAVVVVAAIFFSTFRPQYNRLEFDREKKASDNNVQQKQPPITKSFFL